MPARSGVRQAIQDRIEKRADHGLGAGARGAALQTHLRQPPQPLLVQNLAAALEHRVEQRFLLPKW